VPRRDTTVDWSAAVDGTDPRTDWKGYHTPDEMPVVENPPSGWMQNTNSTPFLTTTDDVNPKRADYPTYIGLHPDNWRSRASRAILSGPAKLSFEDWARLAFDTHFYAADREVPLLAWEWKQLAMVDPARAEKLRAMVDGLVAWDRRGTVDSKPALWFGLYASFAGRVINGRDSTTWGRVGGLERARSALIERHGSVDVPLGEFLRLQRPRERNGETHRDDRPSLPMPSVEGTAVGAIFSVWSQRPEGAKHNYAVGGSAYVNVIEFGPKIRAMSIVPFGESGDPESPHFFDQAPLFAQGKFKQAFFTLDEIKANLERSYRPGREK